MRHSRLVLPLLALCVTLLVFPASGAGPNSLTQTLHLPDAKATIHYPSGWSEVHYADQVELQAAAPAGARTKAGEQVESPVMRFWTETRKDHAEAVHRLREIAAESNTASTFLTIGGWPALQRTELVAKPRSGPRPSSPSSRGSESRAGTEDEEESLAPPENLVHVTTAVAVGRLLFRMDGYVSESLDPAIAAQIATIGRAITFQAGASPESGSEVETLKAAPMLRTTPPPPKPKAAQPTTPKLSDKLTSGNTTQTAGLSFNLQITETEPEVAVSTDGMKIVAVNQFNFRTSNDGGKTFPFTGSFASARGGDSSIGFGKSGNFYEATIGTAANCVGANDNTVPPPAPVSTLCSTPINRSTDGGRTFPFLTNAFVCNQPPFSGANPKNCSFNGVPDQEHLAADRYNASSTGGDQVYVAWRKPFGYGISCSNDSGANWSTAKLISRGSVDFPRITVGQDGSVYVALQNGNNIEIDKYTSCSSGFTGPTTHSVATGLNLVTCPVPGLDRCNDGNILTSMTAAVDDTNANHVFVAYAINTVTNVNENVILQDSIDGGTTWTRPGVQMNNSISGRRFMPWVCSVGGKAYVSWYDRRNATATSDDLTDFFAGSAGLNALGNLAADPDFMINAPNTSDPQCAGGTTKWRCGTRNPSVTPAGDSESCSTQPQLAGFCRHTPNNNTDSFQRCDFSDDKTSPRGPFGCTDPNETCQGSGGCPKYGDYTGNACIAGRLYTVFGSATSQPVATPTGGSIDLFISQKLVCCDPQIQLPAPISLSACAGSTASTTANVCNTGKADLEVDAITFSDFHFFANTPSSGFPVIVSPDSCFPFQVNFAASGTSTVFGTMTVLSNDTVNPSATVPITGNVNNASIATAIANSGDFGGVCIGSVGDLPLTINNVGQCPLSVSNITSTDPEFSTASVLNFPLSVAPGGSLNLQIQFKPTLPTGNKTSNINVFSNDPVTPDKIVPVLGQSQAPLVSVTGTNNFGNVCAGIVKDETFKVCNLPVAGTCQLNVTKVSLNPGCKDFTIESNPFPEFLGAEVCGNVVVRFTPTSDGTKTCNLIVTSTDPATPIDVVPLTGTTPIPKIALSPALAFSPTVEGRGVCAVTEPFPVRNTGICPLTVTGVTLGPPDAVDYALVNLPNQTNVIPPGGALSQGGFGVRFAPVELNRNVDSAVDVTYISDPILLTKTTLARNLCGEGVFVGARVLVTQGGVPVSTVDRIQLIQLSTNTVVDNVFNAALKTITPKIAACAPFQFQREYGTVSDPKHLAPGSYQAKVTLTVAGKQVVKTATFTDNSCGFAHPVVVAF